MLRDIYKGRTMNNPIVIFKEFIYITPYWGKYTILLEKMQIEDI